MLAVLKKEYLRTGLKILVGAGLIYYVLQSNMIDFEALGEVVFSPGNILTAMAFLLVMVLSVATRWFLLVRAQGLSLSYKSVIQLTMIGIFFNTFMLGSVGGDVIKAWYVAGEEPKQRTKAIFTVLLDRIIGLSVIIFAAAGALFVFSDKLAGREELSLLAQFIWGFTALAVFFLFFFFLSVNWKLKVFQKGIDFLRRLRPLAKIIDAVLLYRHHAGSIFLSVGCSCINVLGLTLLFYFFGKSLGIDMSLGVYFFVVPIGLTVSAIPILPGGIGVGQVAFYTLFSWMGMANPEQGGTLCTMFHIYMVLFNCTGIFFYIRFRRKPAFHGVKSREAMTEGVSTSP